MPELPEVETVKRGLEKLIVGKTIATVSFDTARSFPNLEHDVKEFLIGSEVKKIARRGKVLLIELSSEYSLVVHLKMTGQLVFVGRSDKRGLGNGKLEIGKKEITPVPSSQPPIPADNVRFGAGHPNDSLVGKLPDKSTRVTITFIDSSKLFFNDQRKFGWMRLLPTVEVPNINFMRTVGPEPLEDDFTAEQFIGRLTRRSKSNIKSVLLDQKVVAGIGNIYADESLFAAKIHPATLVRDVPKAKLETLFRELRAILNLAIEKGGSTDRNYIDAEGKKGSYLAFAKVFRRNGQPCLRCGTIIEKSKVAGRGTHVCPKCQKAE
jgi:formamidopyrimidine-DNA glycosylase